jgi:excisionase family DNA binding protein
MMMNTTVDASFDVVLLTIPAAMHRLSVCRSTVYELLELGELVSVKLGRSRRITAASVDAFVARRVADAMAPVVPPHRMMG